MPELPEVETIRKELYRNVLGKTINRVIVKNPKVIKEPSRDKFVRFLKNARIKNVIRKGKSLILGFSNGKFLTVHLRMTGQLVYPGAENNARVSFKLSDGNTLDYNDRRLLGELRLVDDWSKMRFFQALGPEIVELTPKAFSQMLSKKTTKIKPLIMDQSFIAGVGNIYAAEALFRARIHPQRSAKSLSGKEKQLLFKEIKDTLSEATKHKGSSIDQYVRLSGKSGGYEKYHKVYGKENEPCLKCKAKIKRIALGGRGTYFCPNCQK